jgi:hypothetical protein
MDTTPAYDTWLDMGYDNARKCFNFELTAEQALALAHADRTKAKKRLRELERLNVFVRLANESASASTPTDALEEQKSAAPCIVE